MHRREHVCASAKAPRWEPPGRWSNGELSEKHNELIDKHNDLVRRHNKLVASFNRNIAEVNPVGPPIAAYEDERAAIVAHHRNGKSLRWIAEEMNLSRRTVTTVITKIDGTDRTMNVRGA
jgi:hypothetical protein